MNVKDNIQACNCN